MKRIAFFIIADVPYILQEKNQVTELMVKHDACPFWVRHCIVTDVAKCLQRAEPKADVFRTYGTGHGRSVEDIAFACGITE